MGHRLLQSDRRRPIAAVLAACMVLTLPGTIHAGPSEDQAQSRAEELYYKGSARYSAADYAGAIDSFTAALEAATRDGAEASVRGALLLNLAQSHVKAYGVDGKARHLRVARDIYQRYIDESERAEYPPEDVADAEERMTKIDQRLATLQVEGASEQPSSEPSEPMAMATADVPVATNKPMRATGIALTTVGAVLVAGGVAGIAYGATFKSAAERQVEREGAEGTPEGEAFIEQEAETGRIWMGVGGGLAALGVAGVVAGPILLVKSKSRATHARLRVGPWATQGLAGVTLRGRF